MYEIGTMGRFDVQQKACVVKPQMSGERINRMIVRSLDVVIAASALFYLMPLLLIVALFVKMADPGPVFFGHRRVGQGGYHFKCYKFRTMVVDADARLRSLLEQDPEARKEWAADHKLRNDPRITAIGSFLRKTSIDELPQLFNVLKGEMSIVGPRPIVDAEVVRYGHYFKDYCSVYPGITGLWQISGRNDVSYRRRVALDVSYARNRSVLLYLGIIIKTIPAVLRGKGSY
jgi:Undecaprenyl-phosphate galactose phosphotransferase WbaP